ncbi:hypothetical protein SLW73_09150 [Glutamicibacter protophormiae]|uniref:hypothetical protein n=1 Tax=Glutamicibacter protophormiae TaxID=37930 RepID=UPI002A83982E|nr:hypothetical protein [Glutamicibacter protophormiae]WPR63076.1 hypothetical protein SLW72_09155 [Glutamicibacter protophormiae]WPR66573.1 hypothetical protein SLW73_09150 [Glutamicibacter protophormiae]
MSKLFGIILLSFVIFAPLPGSSIRMESDVICPEFIMRVNPKDIQQSSDECPAGESEDYSPTEPWFQEPHSTKKKEKPRYKVREYDTCIPGMEVVLGCKSNPDVKVCKDGSYPIQRQVVDLQGLVLQQYSYCPGDPVPTPEGATIREEEIRVTPAMFRSFPILESRISSDPDGFSLKNGNTHFWAIRRTQEFQSNFSGSDVRIKAIPIQWNWSYGDGTTRSLNFPGEAAPEHTLHDETPTSHVYKETGPYSVGVTTLYRGEFSVDGGPWQRIPGQAAIPSTPIQMDVWKTKKELIAND